MGTGIDTLLTSPADSDLDIFDSGVDEVDSYFRSRQWFNPGLGKAKPPTYTFLEEGTSEVIGYAAVAFRNLDHPRDGAGARAKYLTVYVAGIDTRFQGGENPQAAGKTYAVSVFDAIEELARTKSQCVGLSLWVREDNRRALAFYRKYGFIEDPSGPVQQNGGSRHVTMRKIFSP